jgi:hypothetical protein
MDRMREETFKNIVDMRRQRLLLEFLIREKQITIGSSDIYCPFEELGF